MVMDPLQPVMPAMSGYNDNVANPAAYTDKNIAQRDQRPTPDGSLPSAVTGNPLTPAQQKLAEFNADPKAVAKQKAASDKAAADLAKQTEQQRKDAQEKEQSNVDDTNDQRQGIRDGFNNFMSQVKMPSLLLLFSALIFFIWLLVPTASGYTRLQLVWFTLTGKTFIAGAEMSDLGGGVAGSSTTAATTTTATAKTPVTTTNTDTTVLPAGTRTHPSIAVADDILLQGLGGEF